MTAYPDENTLEYYSIEMHSLTKEAYNYYKALLQQLKTDGGGYSPSPARSIRVFQGIGGIKG